MAKRKPSEKSDEEWRAEFGAVLAAAFGEFVCPPVPYWEASFGEWVDVVLSLVGRDVTLGKLVRLSKSEIVELAQMFGSRFGCKAPKVVQIETAIAHVVSQWPVGTHVADAGPGNQ